MKIEERNVCIIISGMIAMSNSSNIWAILSIFDSLDFCKSVRGTLIRVDAPGVIIILQYAVFDIQYGIKIHFCPDF